MEKQTENLTLGQAIEALKEGAHISRKAWDIGRYIEYLPDGIQKDPRLGTGHSYGPCVMMWISRRRHVFWVPCCDDLFAHDWFIVK